MTGVDSLASSCHAREMKTVTERAWEYVRMQRGRWPELCREANVNYHWLCKFSQRRIRNPSADIIEKLMNHAKSS